MFVQDDSRVGAPADEEVHLAENFPDLEGQTVRLVDPPDLGIAEDAPKHRRQLASHLINSAVVQLNDKDVLVARKHFFQPVGKGGYESDGKAADFSPLA